VIDKLEVGEIVGVQVPRTPYTIFKMDEAVLPYRAHCPFDSFWILYLCRNIHDVKHPKQPRNNAIIVLATIF